MKPADVTEADREAAADLIERYWSGADANMMKLAASYRAGHSHGVFVRAFADHRIAAFEAGRVAGLEEAASWHDQRRAEGEAHHITYCNKTGVFANVSPYTPAIGRHRKGASAIRALKENNNETG